MILFKKITTCAQIFFNTQTKLLASFFMACVFVFSLPSQGLSQTVQHELKATVLPPANADNVKPKNTPANNATSQSESGSVTAPVVSGNEKPEEIVVETFENSSGAIKNNGTSEVGEVVGNAGSPDANATLATGVSGGAKSANATGSAEENKSNSLNSMGDDEYFKVAPKEQEAFSWSGYFVAVGGLLLVLAVLWMFVWLLRKRGVFPGAKLMKRNSFKIEATLPLGPKRCLMLVRFLNCRYLLGVTDQQITLIKELEEQDAQGNQSSKNVTGSGSTVSSAGNRAENEASGKPAPNAGPLDFAQALHEESQKNDGKLQL